jgi:heme exporter protein B
MKPGTTTAACVALLRRDFKLIWRRRGDALNPLLFAIIVVALFPLALGPETALLARIAAGTILVAVLLAMLLSLDTLFRSDLDDGSLEQLVLSPHPLALLLACKIFVHWLTTALPLLAVSPLLAQLLHMPADVLSVLLAALALSTPLLSLIGAVCVALTVGMRRSGMLLALLVLPLIMPVLIFGAGACDAAQMGLAYTAPLLWLSAWLVVALVAAPLAAAAALKISLT